MIYKKNSLDNLIKQNIIERHTFKENDKDITLYWKKRKIGKIFLANISY